MKSAERTSDLLLSGSADPRGGSGRLIPALFLLLLILLLLAGCASAPERTPRELLSYLPGGHSGYLSVAPSQEPFLTSTVLGTFGFAEDEARRMADRTDRALLGLGPDGSFSLVAQGRYPDGSIARSLRRQGWMESEENGRLRWTNPSAPYRIERIERDFYAVTAPGASAAVGEAATASADFALPGNEARRLVEARLGFYAPEPGRTMLPGILGRGELPIQDVYVEFRPSEQDSSRETALREVVSVVTVRNEEDARTLLVLTRLLVLATLNAAGIAFDEIPDSLTVEREGPVIVIDGLFLREAQIARLFLDRLPGNGMSREALR